MGSDFAFFDGAWFLHLFVAAAFQFCLVGADGGELAVRNITRFPADYWVDLFFGPTYAALLGLCFGGAFCLFSLSAPTR